MRRLADLLLSAVGLLAVLLPLAAIAGLVRLCDGRPVLFRQTRIGRAGRRFQILKFRTMDPSRSGHRSLTVGNDLRITRLGRWLRITHLDELPQLWNIFRGDMTFIGPRPEVPEFVDRADPLWRRVLAVRPGLFDEATLRSFDEEARLGEVDNWRGYYRHVILPVKLTESIRGIEGRSLASDLVLLCRMARQSWLGADKRREAQREEERHARAA
jgi:lipopolysaccharide/colanic/teichoic acid biosynthesis glycosyltransferase